MQADIGVRCQLPALRVSLRKNLEQAVEAHELGDASSRLPLPLKYSGCIQSELFEGIVCYEWSL